MSVMLLVALVALSGCSRVHPVGAFTLTDAFKRHDGLLCDKWEHYFDVYEEVLSNYRSNAGPIHLMEIGVSMGGCLQLWREYFGAQVTVTGVDIDARLCEDPIFDKGIEMLCFNILTNAAKRDLLFGSRVFDIVIDDASHHFTEVIGMFGWVFPHVSPGGVYVVEDISASYWPSVGGGTAVSGTSVEFFKSLVDFTNCNDAYDIRNLDSKNSYYCEWIDHVRFYEGIIMVFKRKSPRGGHLARRVNSGYQYPPARDDGPKILYRNSLLGFFHNTRNMGLPEDRRQPPPQLPLSNHIQYEASDPDIDPAAEGGVAEGGGTVGLSFRFGIEPPDHKGYSIAAPLSLFPAHVGRWTVLECEMAMRFAYDFCMAEGLTGNSFACPDVVLELLVNNINRNWKTQFVIYDEVRLAPFQVDSRHVPVFLGMSSP